ncbi:nucleoside hydrolase [Flexibacterium corallicola]|uniref:nucleoside hydrolase n=1 Tax=Flexibacterium corallicola TaxID=3037259 RepID=UPI00286F61E7|nr:nucleoside hydrolase [Pseudovibrio sp. M1P-2-3]
MFIVDTDGGTDDILALLMLIGMGRKPDLITTSYGNVDAQQASLNVLDCLSVIGEDIPVHMGATRPLKGPVVDATYVHSEDGLGGAPRPQNRQEVASTDAIGELKGVLRRAVLLGVPVEILTLGPLTNLAMVLMDEPELIKGVKRLWVMGGTCRGRGNYTPASEFNIFCDPEAADSVLGLPINTLMIPWEPVLHSAVSGHTIDAMFEKLPDSALRNFAAAICDHGRSFTNKWYGEDNLIMPDPLAAACLLDDEVATRTIICGVLVECEGKHARGVTILDFEAQTNRPVIGVVEKVDRVKLESLFEASLRSLAGGA